MKEVIIELSAICSRCHTRCSANISGKMAALSKDNCSHFDKLWPKKGIFTFVEITQLPPEQKGVK